MCKHAWVKQWVPGVKANGQPSNAAAMVMCAKCHEIGWEV